MDLLDLEYEINKKTEDLERQIRRINSRIDEMWETLNELRTNVNTILNGDDTDEGT